MSSGSRKNMLNNALLVYIMAINLGAYSHFASNVSVTPLVIAPIAFLVVQFVMIQIWKNSPEGFRMNEDRATHERIIFSLCFLVAGYDLSFVFNAFNPSIPSQHSLSFFVSLFLILLGNSFGKTTRNFAIGILTPWTLGSEDVWRNTHRVAGKLLVASGFFTLFFVKWKHCLELNSVLLSANVTYCAFYSYRNRKVQTSSQNQNVVEDSMFKSFFVFCALIVTTAIVASIKHLSIGNLISGSAAISALVGILLPAAMIGKQRFLSALCGTSWDDARILIRGVALVGSITFLLSVAAVMVAPPQAYNPIYPGLLTLLYCAICIAHLSIVSRRVPTPSLT